MEKPAPPPRFARLLERTLLSLGGLVLCAPGLLALVFRCLPALWPGATWLHDTTLVGVARPPSIHFSWSELAHARYQQELEQTFDTNFPARELFIRLANELWWRAFGACGMSGGDLLVIGPTGTAYSAKDVEYYCHPQPPGYDVEEFARQTARLQEICRQRGIAFAVVISPSKATTYPEELPRAWLRWRQARPSAYDVFRQALTSQGVTLVDGQALTSQARPTAKVPLFPRGAMHWNSQAAMLTSNALLETFRAQGKAVQPMAAETMQYSDQPRGAESDLVGLMNLIMPWRYPVVDLTVRRQRTADSDKLNVVFVGTSFAMELVDLLTQSGQFAEIDSYFYYLAGKTVQNEAGVTGGKGPLPPLDYEKEIFSADALVLEINVPLLARGEFQCDFVRDALQHPVASPAQPKLFPASDGEEYQWGEEIHFGTGTPHEVKRGALTGFSGGEASGTWTAGERASVCLLGFPPPGDLALDIDAAAFVDARRLPAQSVEISVNDEIVGRWDFSSLNPAHRQLVIPARLLGGARHVLRFHLLNPASPAALGLGGDERRLGLLFLTLRLSPVAPASP